MRKIFLIAAMALFHGSMAFAGVLQSIKWDASGTTIATTYTLSGANNVSVPLAAYAGQICCFNKTSDDVALYVDNDLSTVAPTADLQDWYIPSTVGSCLPLNVRLSRTVQIRSAGSSISGGKVYCSITDRKG